MIQTELHRDPDLRTLTPHVSETFKTAGPLLVDADGQMNGGGHSRIGIRGAGCDDLLLFPCTGELDQVALLAEALDQQGEMDP